MILVLKGERRNFFGEWEYTEDESYAVTYDKFKKAVDLLEKDTKFTLSVTSGNREPRFYSFVMWVENGEYVVKQYLNKASGSYDSVRVSKRVMLNKFREFVKDKGVDCEIPMIWKW